MTPQPNPFRDMPFPGSGGEYRCEGGALVANVPPAPAHEAALDAEAPAKAQPTPEADSGETAPPAFPRRNRNHKE